MRLHQLARFVPLVALLTLTDAAPLLDERIPVLVVTGESDTDWRWTSTRLRQVLHDTGKFEVTVSIYPHGDLADRWYLDRFQVVVLDYDGKRLGQTAETNLLAAAAEGLGVVAVGRGSLAFDDWDAYGELVGLRGAPADGAQPELLAIEVVGEHPLTEGLGAWDGHVDVVPSTVELVEDSPVEVLARVGLAPVLVAGEVGSGRVVATTLGQVPGTSTAARASHDEGFDQLVFRSCEWAATGEVTPLRRLEPNTLSDADRAAGWSLLFDGASTEGWVAMDGRALGERLVVENGSLKVLPDAAAFDFVYGERFDAFELEAEWRVAPGTELPPEAALSDLLGAGSVDPILRPAGEFNHGRVVAHDGSVEHYLNGVRLLSLYLSPEEWAARITSDPRDDPVLGQLPLARLMVQRPGTAVWIRNVKIRKPPAPAAVERALPRAVELFDGASLGGWRWQPKAKGSNAPPPFEVEGGVVVDKGWPLGTLHSEQTFGDFVLELDYLTPSTTKNPATGGVMVRVTGDEFWPRGLEVSLENGRAGDIWAHDRFPVDSVRFRTKGIVTERLRDMERRRDEWNHLEVRLEGDAITVRLNGEVVNSATGLDRAPGEVAIKAEGAEFLYRELRIRPLE